MCVCFFVEVFGTNQPKVSRHLAYLRRAVLERFTGEGLLGPREGLYDITNLGALLFAKNLDDFDGLARKCFIEDGVSKSWRQGARAPAPPQSARVRAAQEQVRGRTRAAFVGNPRSDERGGPSGPPLYVRA